MELSLLMKSFDVSGRLVTINPTGNGNVNDTFLAIFRNTFAEEQVILQRVNRNVFPQPEAIMHNLRCLTAHVHPKLESEAERADRVWQMPRIVKTRGGTDFFVDDAGDTWRVITKIASATAFDETQGAEHAAECGAVLGHFHWLVSDLDPRTMIDPLPGFHIMPAYLAKYDATLKSMPLAAERLNRMMHGDPKVNNIMIDDYTGKGTAMIDLDTVSPGLIHYDFGDALRSICNHAGEEEQNLSKVVFDLDLCSAFCKGYMAHARGFLTDSDRKYLYDSIRLITFELGLRFFQDYLAGSVYFKVQHPEQNLNRARVQFRLCESIEARERPIRELLAGL
ncbi:MAG: N-acetylhexosamine 1-kinase [Chloroflexi bacterium ADurb.Bin325]|nr:MAG: N-acetylhexosamine 1-kinase [Chloroflexi bacterium ADurb.Bin325]